MQTDLSLINSWRTSGNVKARNELALRYTGAVVNLSGRYPLRHLTRRDDLIQEGMLSLLIAIDKFDTSRGTAFWTCARFYVRDAMYTYVLKSSGIDYNHAPQDIQQGAFTGEHGATSFYNPVSDTRLTNPILDAISQEQGIQKMREIIKNSCNERQQLATRYEHAEKFEKGEIKGDLHVQQMKRAYSQAINILKENFL